jgi:hypothetical protein
MSKAGEQAKKIIHFFCRPCGEYHLKAHPHYRAMKRRKASRLKEKASRAVTLIPSADFDILIDAFKTLTELAPSLEPKVRQRFFKVLDGLLSVLEFITEIVGIDRDGLATSSANNAGISVGFKLPDSYRSFMAALGARNVDLAVKHSALL